MASAPRDRVGGRGRVVDLVKLSCGGRTLSLSRHPAPGRMRYCPSTRIPLPSHAATAACLPTSGPCSASTMMRSVLISIVGGQARQPWSPAGGSRRQGRSRFAQSLSRLPRECGLGDQPCLTNVCKSLSDPAPPGCKIEFIDAAGTMHVVFCGCSIRGARSRHRDRLHAASGQAADAIGLAGPHFALGARCRDVAPLRLGTAMP